MRLSPAVNRDGYLRPTATTISAIQHASRFSLKFGAAGFNAFRRFRATQTRMKGTPRELEKFWLGHANDVTDRYTEGTENDVGSDRSGRNVSGLVLA